LLLFSINPHKTTKKGASQHLLLSPLSSLLSSPLTHIQLAPFFVNHNTKSKKKEQATLISKYIFVPLQPKKNPTSWQKLKSQPLGKPLIPT
jgi:hypothetical protein